MHRFSGLIVALTEPLLWAAGLMQSGRWCSFCHDAKDKTCDEGKCLEVDLPQSAADTVHHEPVCEWGGGD